MSRKSLIENTVGKITQAAQNLDKLSIEVNGYEYWLYLTELWDYMHLRLDAIPVRHDVVWGFSSSPSASGTVYVGGYYDFSGANNDFSPAINYGSADGAKAAHILIVTGAETVDEVTITVTGTSITDEAVRTTSDTDTITIPASTPANSYFEVKKFIGQVSIETTAGTAIQCNYGWVKYWDNGNTRFDVIGLDVTWYSEANTSTSDLILRKHTSVGWAYNLGADPTPPTPVAQMSTDYVDERNTDSGEFGAWKRTDLFTSINGVDSEGVIVEFIAGAAKTFTFGNFALSILEDTVHYE